MAAGAAARVGLVLSEDGPAYQEFVGRFRSVVGASRSFLLAGRAADFSAATLAAEAPELIVAVGMRAAEAVLRADTGRPVLAVLVPRLAYPHLRSLAKGQAFTAIYLDQPLERRLGLVVLALPDRRRLATLVGPDSAADLKPLQNAAAERGLAVTGERIEREADLLPALRRVLASADVFLAIPDPLVINGNTAQSILLTTYRAQVPVVGYSKAYVDAGALLAVYSTPAQIAQQAAEMVAGLGAFTALPAPQYPKYYSVAVNAHVARSMGIAIEPETVLLERLKALGARE